MSRQSEVVGFSMRLDGYFGYSVMVRDGLFTWRSVPIYHGLAGYRAWVAAGSPQGAAAVAWAENFHRSEVL